MSVYSHSRLSCYEQCPQKYKLQYIDKVETEVEESIEAYLGSRVHETLEKLYRDLGYQKVNTLDELLDFFRSEWKKNWDDSVVIVKEEYGPENYLKMGEKFITDYYNKYKPFDQGKTIALEERVLITLDDAGEYKLQGFIDRVMESEEGYYEVHDYKTNSRLPLLEYLDNDRQLALYAIGIKDRYPDVKDVRLVWHFLAFNKEVDSTRTDEELESLKKGVIELIEKIENDEKFAANPSLLCDWCEFKPICRQWSHLYMIKEKPENEYLNDPGVKLVERYVELKAKEKQVTLDIYAELEKIEEALIVFSEKEGVETVFGSHYKIRVKDTECYSFPSKNSSDRKQLVQTLKDLGKWDEVVQLDTAALNKIIQEKQWDSKSLDVLEQYVRLEKSKRLYLSKIKNSS
ncbi:MAG: PD-(D/E)XK nuclease family protein [Nanoarchaeota archaeon]|nr:PD-(D/E)XK nuclease family protein [Nanoarchaeota archaeon]